MKILLHDFGGYPFPIQLSRELAGRGHQVTHVVCGSLTTTPGDSPKAKNGDPATLQFDQVNLPSPLNKYSLFKRWYQENQYGKLLAKKLDEIKPDLVISANTPLDAQWRLQKKCIHQSIPFVFWLQDIISVASDRLLRKKLPVVGGLIGKHYLNRERNMLHRSDWNVLITEDFLPLLSDWGIPQSRCTVIENWGPITDLPVGSKDNSWSSQRGVHDGQSVVYTGTLGLKHNPDLLLQLAIRLRDLNDTNVLVVSQGRGADWLKQKALELDLKNLRVYDFGPFQDVPKVMATADVLVAVLEPDAGVYSVPSKVLAYLCAERPLVIAVPKQNLAARLVTQIDAGHVVDPSDTSGFVESVVELLQHPEQSREMGQRARQYAEETFAIEKIADAFEDGIRNLMGNDDPTTDLPSVRQPLAESSL